MLKQSIDLSPVLTLIGGEARFPLRGDDPRSVENQKVFSAWPVTSDLGTEVRGHAFFFLERVNTKAYYEELSQHLNAPIAMYVTDQRQLITNGIPDLESLRDLAGHAMVINPTAEIYLLDLEGNILGHTLPAETDGRIHLTARAWAVRGTVPG